MPTLITQDLDYHKKRLRSLQTEQSSWRPEWKVISENLLPRSGRFLVEDRNKGNRRNENIIDQEATQDLNVLAAGMLAGMSSPARQWFRLTSPNRDLANRQNVREWLDHAGDVLMAVFANSNVYRTLVAIFRDLGAFGTSMAYRFNDFEDAIRLYYQPIGLFYLAQNNREVIDTVYREFQMQIGPLAMEYGEENLSQAAKNLLDNRKLDEWITVCHAVEPRFERNLRLKNNRNMRFLSRHWEKDGTESNKFLRDSGFDEFPAITPRWDAMGGDVYGSNSPGWEALGSLLSLQSDQYSKAKVIDYKTDPPLQIPSTLKNKMGLLPGGTVKVDQTSPNGGVRTAFDVDLDINVLLENIGDTRARIRRSFHTELFQAFLFSDQRDPKSATEILKIHEEKLVLLGPTLERQQDENLDPLVEESFSEALRLGLFKDVPQEVLDEGMDIEIEYVSMLAQAQKAVGLGGLERIIGTIQALETFIPGTRHKLKADDVVDEIADIIGIAPRLIATNGEVAFIRQQEAKQLQAQNQAETLPNTAQAVKTLSETDTEGDSALQEITQQVAQVS